MDREKNHGDSAASVDRYDQAYDDSWIKAEEGNPAQRRASRMLGLTRM
jgi:hypothetical protein